MPGGSRPSTDRNTLFKVYGLLIDSVLDSLGVPKPRGMAKKLVQDAFKEAYGIRSVRGLDNASLSLYIDSIKAYFAIEHGIYIRAANEPEGAAEMALSQYLKSMENISKGKIFDKLETLYNFHSYRERRRFLCDLTDTPLTSVIGNQERLIDSIKEWLNFN